MMISDDKAKARKQAFQARKGAHSLNLDEPACCELTACLEGLEPFETIAAYMPIRTEVSPLSVMQQLVTAGKVVAVPVIQAAGLPLRFSRWQPGGPMVEGPFGARIPAENDFVVPDILITPLVAFDQRGYRLGYGGGFYDRSFEELRAKQPTLAIGFAYSAQELDQVPTEPTDVRLDYMVTETGTKKF